MHLTSGNEVAFSYGFSCYLAINVKVHLTPNFFFSLNKISVFFGVFQCKNFLNRSNPRFSVPLRSPTRNGSLPRIGDLGRARLWRQMENDANVLSVITLFFGIFRRLSTTKIISLGLHSRQNSEKFYNVLHFKFITHFIRKLTETQFRNKAIVLLLCCSTCWCL